MHTDMTTEQAIQIAEVIARGSYEPAMLDHWVDFLETAPAGEATRVLEVYYDAVKASDQPPKVSADFMEKLKGLLPAEETPAKIRKMNWWWPAAAASVILLAASVYFLTPRNTTTPTDLVQQPATDVKPPATNRAMIRLANGGSVYLDSTDQGQLALQDNVKLVKLADGKIAYEGTTTETIYNTLYNPRGSKPVDMTLSDGSRVWLNAGSSVTYPVAFAGKERKVSIDGEAYFEVAHDASKPFLVDKGNMEVTVLGTHFNIKAYDEESEIQVTLLEGSVEVTSSSSPSGEAGVRLKPGQQAQVKDGIKVNDDIDVEAVMAWKNGRFMFQGTGTEETLREIARWYDVELEFRGKPAEQHFGGDISRNVEASKVFEMLENTGVLHVKIEGKKIIVLP